MNVVSVFFFFFNDTATTEIYTLSLHDALPISSRVTPCRSHHRVGTAPGIAVIPPTNPPANPTSGTLDFLTARLDRKSTRLNSSHANISYAVFCLKKKKKEQTYGSTLYNNTDLR